MDGNEQKVAMKEITICMVSCMSSSYIKHNLKLLREQDHNIKMHLLLCKNDTEEEELENLKILNQYFDSGLIKQGSNKAIVDRWSSSYNHGIGLNSLVEDIKTRYVLFLDPDFYIYSPLSNVIDRMERKKLALFGAPYYKGPRFNSFPASFCQFIDLSLVKREDLNFLPDKEGSYDFVADVGFRIRLAYENSNFEGLQCYDEFPFLFNVAYNNEVQKIAVQPFPSNIDCYFLENRFFGYHIHQRLQKPFSSLENKLNRDTNIFEDMDSRFSEIKEIWRNV